MEQNESEVFERLPMELHQHVFSFLSCKDICQIIRQVCKNWADLADEKEKRLWKAVLQRDFVEIGGKLELEEVSWSVSKRGEYLVCKTLWLQHKGKEDKEWSILGKNDINRKPYVQEGRTENGKLQGFAREKSASGIYEGEWVDGLPEGSGSFSWDNGLLVLDFSFIPLLSIVY